MTDIFKTILELSILGSLLILGLLFLRVLPLRFPKWGNTALWGLVGLRLLVPFHLESQFSLIPGKELVHSELTGNFTEVPPLDVTQSTPALSNALNILTVIWAAGVGVMMLHFLWLRVMCEEWRLSVNYIGEVIASAPSNSISLTQGFAGTVNTALAMLYLFKLIALLIPVHFCIFIGEKCQSFEKAFLFSGVFILLPAAAYYFGADALSFVTPASFLADSSPIFYGTNTIHIFAVWMLLSLLVLFAAKRNWCKTVQ